jgi:hypothetical protein
MWRPRDRERFIGSYDPEHELPDPDRDAGDRWQSDAYRRSARDTRFAYRLNPDYIEGRYDGPRRDIDRERDVRWQGDARDRENFERGYRAGYQHGFERGSSRAFDRGPNRDFERDREFDRGGFMTGPRFDRDRNRGSDRGWDHDRFGRGPGGGYDDWDRGGRGR